MIKVKHLVELINQFNQLPILFLKKIVLSRLM